MGSKAIYPAMFLVSGSTLVFQLIVTRILSVTLLYHFSLMVISLSMLGLTGGAIFAYRCERWLSKYTLESQLGVSALLFGLTMPLSVHAHVGLFYVLGVTHPMILILATCLFIAIPLLCSGLFVCLALTKWPEPTGSVYAADLTGAAAGCFAIVALLSFLNIASFIFMAALAAIIAALLIVPKTSRLLAAFVRISLILLAATLLWQQYLESKNESLFSIRTGLAYTWREAPLYDKWNSYSRITVTNFGHKPYGWGLSDNFKYQDVDQLMMTIDTVAYSPLVKFDGDFSKVDFLKHDVINSVHNLRHNADVFIGSIGGGRDILSALAYGQKNITAVEINNNVAAALKSNFASFTGNIATRSNVHLKNEDARSYLYHTPDKFDIIQISLVDTSAAASAGGLVLTENSLYTIEAWKLFISKLKPRGILSVSRWLEYNPGNPVEGTRLLFLAQEALKETGIENPQDHLLVLRTYPRPNSLFVPAITVLLSPDRWSAEDISTITTYASENGFGLISQPQHISEPWIADVIDHPDLDKLESHYASRLNAPKDDITFFFEMGLFSRLLNLSDWTSYTYQNLDILKMLVVLLVLSLAVALLCVLSVLRPTQSSSDLRGRNLFAIYFLSIGCGFMLIEISYIQRFIVFLGHPALSLSLILASLLISGGLGSYLTGRMDDASLMVRAGKCLIALCLLLFVFIYAVPLVINSFDGQPRLVRMAIVFIFVSISGIFMGTCFPIGMRLVGKNTEIAPMFWALNGAASIFASILQMFVALALGIMYAFSLGVLFYLCATLVLLLYLGKNRAQTLTSR
jgi:hypothetical protein